ncbi:MAG: PEGA domain-containing protein, partial [Polyangiaceae bacterium]|nr:PEGA domain-containing protein [Polyangiaceae bacterium]
MRSFRKISIAALAASLTLSSIAGAQPAVPAKDAPAKDAPAKDAPPAPPAPPAEESAPKQVDAAAKADAEAHFKKGLELLGEEAWAAALAEFLRSREIFPTRTATNNVAVCLRKLKRFDESLDMYVTLLREFPNMPEDKKSAAQKEISELQQLVGTVDIAGAEPGASIVVDGKPRQDFPLLEPLRVSAGTHTIRLFKEGFQPFEQSVDVAGGQTARITAKMPALAASGRLRVAEKDGKRLEVVVDGAVVGVTPWEGSISVGDHVVFLRGDGDLGTQPAAAPIAKGEATSLTLVAETLEASVLIDVQPPSASVRIDGVHVGRGIWDGRLRKGAHSVEALYEGYFPVKRDITLERGEHE